MWLCDTNILCDKHLLGEHVEMHMFLGTLKKGIKVNGYLRNNLFEPSLLFTRHSELAIEMKERGFNHNSGLSTLEFMQEFSKLGDDIKWHEINRQKAFNDLLTRCPMCFARYLKIINAKLDIVKDTISYKQMMKLVEPPSESV